MSDTIISVENLGKKYRISHKAERQRYVALRDVIAQRITTPFRAMFGKNGSRGMKPGASVRSSKLQEDVEKQSTVELQGVARQDSYVERSIEDFWALRDVSFEVKRGEVVGIIGRNGAGKSTLLKILSRITEPTTGRVEIDGRVASLLEVGTGFHPELTGRENIFLNGAILGMHRAEIRAKFDEIVAFAEVEKFLDTPVKRYSSGMYVRLAFAVAAHLEPEILIVDEVLAVGDAEFQKKCLGKMQNVAAQQGRTVLFVSHNMDAISRFCSSSIILNKGRKEFEGATDQAVQKYLASFSQIGRPGNWLDIASCPRRVGGSDAFFHSATYLGKAEGTNLWPLSEEELLFKLRISSEVNRTIASLAVVIYSNSFQKLVNADTLLIGQPVVLEKGLNEIHLRIQRLHLNPGRYPVGLWLANGVNQVFDWIESAFEIEVTNNEDRLGSDIFHDGCVPCDFSIYQPARADV